MHIEARYKTANKKTMDHLITDEEFQNREMLYQQAMVTGNVSLVMTAQQDWDTFLYEFQRQREALQQMSSPLHPAPPRRARKRKILKKRISKKDRPAIDVKLEDWANATEKWKELKQAARDTRNTQNLYPPQESLIAQFNKNPKSIVGEPVIVITTPAGDFWDSYPYPATILKCTENAGIYTFTVLFHPVAEETWDTERIEEVQIYQILPLREFDIPNAKKTKIKPSVFDEVVKRINTNMGSELGTLIRHKTEYVHTIENYQREIKKYEEAIETTAEKIQDIQKNSLGIQDIKNRMDELKNIRGLEWAGLTKDGILILETKPLKAISSKTNKVTKNEIGKFAFHINLYQGNMYGQNMKYSDSYGHGHPNLSGTNICFGNNSTEVKDLIFRAKFPELADFLIFFFSLFGHGQPYVAHSTWLKTKRAYNSPNQWRTLPFVYKVTGEAPESREYKKKGFLSKLTKKTTLKKKKRTPKIPEVQLNEFFDTEDF